MGRKRGRFKQGTFIEQTLLLSPAYVKLSSAGKVILGALLLKRDFNNKHECLNKDDLTMTYKELEAIGLARTSITNGWDDLLAKGFIAVIRLGGAYQEDKSIYGLTDDWRFWQNGDDPVRVRKKGKSAGYHALQQYHERDVKIISTTDSGPTHTTESAP